MKLIFASIVFLLLSGCAPILVQVACHIGSDNPNDPPPPAWNEPCKFN